MPFGSLVRHRESRGHEADVSAAFRGTKYLARRDLPRAAFEDAPVCSAGLCSGPERGRVNPRSLQLGVLRALFFSPTDGSRVGPRP